MLACSFPASLSFPEQCVCYKARVIFVRFLMHSFAFDMLLNFEEGKIRAKIKKRH